jgi:hypothetical protein
MNLIEAIRAGAARVDGRTRGAYIRRDDDYSLKACAMGAAYLGCHPDADPAAIGTGAISTWCDRLVRSELSQAGWVIAINDRQSGDTWEPVIEQLRHALSPEALERDICEAGGE